MFKKWLQKRKEKQKAIQEMQKAKKYYQLIKNGLLFLDFVNQDITKMKKSKLNRSQRRRFEKQLKSEGKLNDEMLRYYATKIDNILEYIEKQSKKK